MTKDEAIEVTRGDFEREYASLFLDESTMHYLVRNSNGEYGYGEVEQCWLMWGRGIVQAPTSEAVAEKPQDDRNAASPAAPAFQDGATASYACSSCYGRGIDVAGKPCACNCLHSAWTSRHSPAPSFFWRPDYEGTLAALEQSNTAGSACQGGNTNAETIPAAQPAADPAPVPTQGIDHAKRAEGRKAFEVEFPLAVWSEDDQSYIDDIYNYAFVGWRARGQQAGVPEDCVIVPKEPTEAMVHAAEDIPPPRLFGKVYRAMIAAAAPGEVG